MSTQYALLENVLDLRQSVACQQGDTCSFKTDDSVITLTMGKEPSLKGSLSLACKAVDALVLQYYEEPDDSKAAFGHDLSPEDWHTFSTIKDYYGDVLFTSSTLSTNLAHPLLKEILAEVKNEQRRFAFLCGHDSNLGSVLGALGWDEYALPSSIEKTPIGAKLVIEKWKGTDGEEYVTMNMVYQSTDQLRQMPLLSLENPPVVYNMELKGLEANDDGLYRLADFEQHLSDRIDAYDDVPSSIRGTDNSKSRPTAAIYDLQGRQVDKDTLGAGIYISNGQKVITPSE
jgi:glucose-1-phosphatase